MKSTVLTWAIAALSSVADFKLAFSDAEHGIVRTFSNTVTSCFIELILVTEMTIILSRRSLNVTPKEAQSTMVEIVVEVGGLPGGLVGVVDVTVIVEAMIEDAVVVGVAIAFGVDVIIVVVTPSVMVVGVVQVEVGMLVVLGTLDSHTKRMPGLAQLVPCQNPALSPDIILKQSWVSLTALSVLG